MSKASKFCTECLSETGEYFRFKTMSVRKYVGRHPKTNRKKYTWAKTGFYQCENCDRVAVEDELYKDLRANNNHIVKKLSTYLEE